jgi:hypothetical protein
MGRLLPYESPRGTTWSQIVRMASSLKSKLKREK